jgi:hypothetical protein
VAPHVDQLIGRRMSVLGTLCSDCLVDHSDDGES